MFLWLYGLLRQEKSGDCGNSGLDTSWYDNYSTCSAKKNTKQKSAHKRLKKSPRSDSSEQFSQLLLLQAFFDTFGSAKPEQGIV